LDIDIPNPVGQYACLGDSMPIQYEKTKGEIDGDTAVFTIAELPKFRKRITIPRANTNSGIIDLPVEDIQKPGHYHGNIAINDRWCINDLSQPDKPEINIPLDIFVRYKSDIVSFKFYNVLAVRQDQGYDFIHYQWYINDRPVGGDVSVLYLGENVVLQETDEVYVRLTDQSGMEMESCPQRISYTNKTPNPYKAPAQKIIRNQRMYIIRDEQMYDLFGREVK
jgi:hypothetical protein